MKCSFKEMTPNGITNNSISIYVKSRDEILVYFTPGIDINNVEVPIPYSITIEFNGKEMKNYSTEFEKKNKCGAV